MQQASRGPRRLVSPLPSPANSQADSNFSVSRYANQGRTPYAEEESDRRPALVRPQAERPQVNGSRIPSNGVGNNGNANGAVQPDNDLRVMDESIARQHWVVFRRFLNSGRDQTHPRQNTAREKLTRLNRMQFHELSTDVYDEVQRRSNKSPVGMASLPPNPKFHPKRNQAREKLASLQTLRLKNLTADVFFEIERRFPLVTSETGEYDRRTVSSEQSIPSRVTSGSDAADLAPPINNEQSQYSRQANPFRQTAVIPNKSMMVEEENNESDYESDLKSPALGSDYASVRSREYANKPVQRSSSATLSDLRTSEGSDHRRQVQELQGKIKQLERSLQERSSDPPLSRQMKREMEELLERNDKLEEENVALKASQSFSNEVSILKAENQRLKAELESQQQITEEVRSEAQGFLDEMRGLSERETAIYERTEKLENQVATLEAETKEWKERYQKSQTQLRKLRATSQFFSPDPQKSADSTFVSADGIIRDVAIVKFQISIDSLLRNARTQIAELMDNMKDVVLAIRSIQSDLDGSPDSGAIKDPRVAKLRQRMSTTVSNLMIAVKNHVNGGSLSPVSLVDAAASHLSSSIIELSKICKLRATSDDCDDKLDFDEPRALGNSNTTITPRVAQATNGLLLSPPSSVELRHDKRTGSSLQVEIPDYDSQTNVNEELRLFLEGQTEGIVSCIQKLLSAIRADAKTQILQAHMGDIVAIVTLVSSTMREAFLTSSTLRSRAGKIVDALEYCTSRIRDMESSAALDLEQQATKEFKQKLAGIAFDTAKQTKELSIVLQEADDDDDDVDLT